jgi:hypothetical protein
VSAGPGTRPKTCRSCGVQIIFARNAKSGKVQIFDPTPVHGDDGGAFLIVSGQATHVPVEKRGETPLFRDHHVSCPDAKRWRGRSRSDPPPTLFDS